MATRNQRIRFMENNFAALTSNSIDYSSQMSGFPATNIVNDLRNKLWIPTGHFLIDSTNENLYINDGSNKTVTITNGKYQTPAALASQIQTDLNSASANWTVTYDLSGGTFKFTIANSGSVTIRLSQISNSIWDTIGYAGTTDRTGTSFIADQQRNHTEEYLIFDFGFPYDVKFIAILGRLRQVFPISETATIKLMGNNLNSWSSPPLEVDLTRYDGGIYKFIDDIDDTRFRYFKIQIIDKFNILGPQGLSFGHLYLGDYITSTTRNAARGFVKSEVDPTTQSESESGVLYFDEKTQYGLFDGIGLQYLSREDKDNYERMFKKLKKKTPFYISLDPTECLTDNLDELTRFVHFVREPRFTHIHADMFSTSISLREVI